MNQKLFNKIIKKRLKNIESMLLSKGAEYANEDRLSNFKDGAAFRKRSPEGICFDYVTKHLVALNEFIDRVEKGIEVTPEQWIEKTQDIGVYMLLLETILVDSKRIPNEDA